MEQLDFLVLDSRKKEKGSRVEVRLAKIRLLPCFLPEMQYNCDRCGCLVRGAGMGKEGTRKAEG